MKVLGRGILDSTSAIVSLSSASQMIVNLAVNIADLIDNG